MPSRRRTSARKWIARRLPNGSRALAIDAQPLVQNCSMVGHMLNFNGNGETYSGYLARATDGDGPGVIVLQEWWGLVGHITNVCDRFAAEGFTALAPDLYRG